MKKNHIFYICFLKIQFFLHLRKSKSRKSQFSIFFCTLYSQLRPQISKKFIGFLRSQIEGLQQITIKIPQKSRFFKTFSKKKKICHKFFEQKKILKKFGVRIFFLIRPRKTKFWTKIQKKPSDHMGINHLKTIK